MPFAKRCLKRIRWIRVFIKSLTKRLLKDNKKTVRKNCFNYLCYVAVRGLHQSVFYIRQ